MQKPPACWPVTSELICTLVTSILQSINSTYWEEDESSKASALIFLIPALPTRLLGFCTRHTTHVGSPRLARTSRRSPLYLAMLGMENRFSNYRVRANITDAATHSKSQLLESTKLCKLSLKVRFVLSYIRKHEESLALKLKVNSWNLTSACLHGIYSLTSEEQI